MIQQIRQKSALHENEQKVRVYLKKKRYEQDENEISTNERSG